MMKSAAVVLIASLVAAPWATAQTAPPTTNIVSESLGALRVADFALIVVHAYEGVGVGTERAWKYATKFGIPKVFVVNGCDADNADVEGTIAAPKKIEPIVYINTVNKICVSVIKNDFILSPPLMF